MSENDNEKPRIMQGPTALGPKQDPAVLLDRHRGMQAQHDTDARRRKSAVRADQDVVRESQAALEKHLFAGPATGWPQAAEKAGYLLRLFAASGEAQDPRYQQLIEDALEDFRRLTGNAEEPER